MKATHLFTLALMTVFVLFFVDVLVAQEVSATDQVKQASTKLRIGSLVLMRVQEEIDQINPDGNVVDVRNPLGSGFGFRAALGQSIDSSWEWGMTLDISWAKEQFENSRLASDITASLNILNDFDFVRLGLGAGLLARNSGGHPLEGVAYNEEGFRFSLQAIKNFYDQIGFDLTCFVDYANRYSKLDETMVEYGFKPSAGVQLGFYYETAFGSR